MQKSTCSKIVSDVKSVIVGKDNCIELIISAMLAGGHVLIEDVPGVGKTQLVASLANACGGDFGRLQMTPDVMPTDITGYTMIHPVTKESEFKKGVAFCNFLLVDEINRASPKAQSALLEIMEERQVSIDGNTYALPHPFMVLATQNPIETYGTYHLPEAQMDRFLIKISLGYPTKEQELQILLRNEKGVGPDSLLDNANSDDKLSLVQTLKLNANEIYCSDSIRNYIVDIVESTRNADFIQLAVSPRGSIALFRMAKAYAQVKERDYVLPDDVKFLAPYVLSHRIILTPKGKSVLSNAENAIRTLLKDIPVPPAQHP